MKNKRLLLTFGEKCVIYRRRAKLKYDQASKGARISNGSIYLIEQDRGRIPDRTRQEYMRFLLENQPKIKVDI
jgi:hypothetical protein